MGASNCAAARFRSSHGHLCRAGRPWNWTFRRAGTRAAELAVRLKYAGVPADRLEVAPGVAGALDSAVSHAGSGRLYVLPTYTALLELRGELASRGHAVPFWEPAAV